MKKSLKEYFAKIGSKGGKSSRRVLTPEQARKMVEAREAKKILTADAHTLSGKREYHDTH